MPNQQPVTDAIEATGELDQGEGKETIVCLHGWCCRTGDFAPQVQALSTKYRVLVVDWQQRLTRRHGSCAFDEICADIASCIQRAGVTRPLLCGHSLGGFLATQIAFEYRLPIRGLLILDSTIPLPDQTRDSWIQMAGRLERGPFGTACEAFVRSVFIDSEQGLIQESVIQGMASQPVDVAVGLVREICSHRWALSLQTIDAPVHMVASQHSQLDMDAFHAYVPSATSERIDNSGHFITLFQAERVCQAMLRMLNQ